MSRRGAGEGTIYRDGKYWVAEIQWTDDDGTHRKRRKRKTRTEAVAARDALAHEITSGDVAIDASSKATVAEVMARYLTEAAGRVKARTLRDYKRSSETAIVPIIGRVRARGLRRADVLRMLASVNGARSKQFAYGLLKAAVAPYLRVSDPVDHPFPPRSAPKVPRRVVPAFDHDLIRAVRAAVRGTVIEAYVLLSLTSGLRPSEVLGLTWADVRLDHLVVHRALDEYTRDIDTTKNDGSRRRNDLPAGVMAVLAAHKEREVARGLPCPPSALVFRNAVGGSVDASKFRKIWTKLRKAHGIPPFRLYDLRHAHASLLAEKGVANKVIAERLGHSSTRLTDDTYQHLMPGMQRASVDIVSNMLEEMD